MTINSGRQSDPIGSDRVEKRCCHFGASRPAGSKAIIRTSMDARTRKVGERGECRGSGGASPKSNLCHCLVMNFYAEELPPVLAFNEEYRLG